MRVKLLDPRAKTPTVAHPGSDLGYDLYALNDVHMIRNVPAKIKTGIAIEFNSGWGGIIKDRSSMALNGFSVLGGVIDGGYRGEIIVIMAVNHINHPVNGIFIPEIKAGQKIAQLILHPANTIFPMEVVEELGQTDRGENGFGSSGR